MDDPIRFDLALTKTDLVRATRYFYGHQAGNLLFVCIILLAAGLAVQTMVRTGVGLNNLLVLVLASAGLIYPYFIHPFQVAEMAAKSGIYERITWNLGEDGITLTTADSETKLEWEVFHDYVETRDAFLLIRARNKRIFQLIPKRALGGAEQVGQFERLLAKKFPGHKPSFFMKH
jgi:hypothetical protein